MSWTSSICAGALGGCVAKAHSVASTPSPWRPGAPQPRRTRGVIDCGEHCAAAMITAIWKSGSR
eukprot:5092403-Lingulodinium_polyedra.AAC.1